jgi:CHAT domain-containing protein
MSDALEDMMAIGGRLEALNEAERRYDRWRDPAALDQVLAVFDELEADPAWSRASARVRAEVQIQVAANARERYETNGDVADLARARRLAEEATGTARRECRDLLPPASRLLARQLIAAFERERDRATLDRALAALEEDGNAPRTDFVRGEALLLRFKAFGERADADAACAALERALESGGEDLRAEALDGLGCALVARSELPGCERDLDRAIEAFEGAVALRPDFPWFRANLGVGLRARSDRDGDRADAERAAALKEEALREIPETAPDRRRLEYNTRGTSAAGTAAARELLDRTPAGARGRPARLAALADALLLDFSISLKVTELDEAIDTHREAAATAPPGSPDRPSMLDGLGRALTARYALLGEPEALDEAIATAEASVRDTRAGAPERAQHLYNLGRARSLRAADRTAATDAFSAAYAAGHQTNPGLAVVAGRAWGEWAAEERAWPEAAEALSRAMEAADHLHRTQVGRRHREHWLGLAPTLASETAVALARAGDPERAVLALERGRARLLADALDRDRAELAGLEATGEAAAYRAATARLEALELAGHGADHREALHTLDAVITRIRALPGHDGFLAPASLADIRAAARDAPLVYLAAADTGTAVIAVRPDGRVKATVLAVDAHAVRHRAAALLSAQQQRGAAPEAWGRAMREVVLWLGEALWPHIADLASDSDRLVFVPAGLLSLLPLHAAAWSDGAGLRYALDERLITYAPSARAVAAARAGASAGMGSVLAVGEPERGDVPPLPHAAAEAEAVRASVPVGRVLTGAAATAAAVGAVLHEHPLLHFACHGRADLRDPLASALLLAGADELSVAGLLEQRLPGCRLAVLSACETSVAGIALPDEVVSLPASLLQAGVGGVVGTLWAVDDLSAMLLVRRMFASLAAGVEPAEALRRAQRWLRDATNEELHLAFPDVVETAPPPLPDALRGVWSATTDRVGAQHWAAFMYTGV